MGFRYGQQVEKTNKKALSLLVSIPPTLTQTPTQPPLEFALYTHDDCGIRFMRPQSFSIEKESSHGAILMENRKTRISFDCMELSDKEKTASNTSAIVFQGKKISSLDDKESYAFDLSYPSRKKTISFYINKRIYPLLESTFEFIK